MNILRRMLSLFILISLIILSTGCNVDQTTITSTETRVGTSESGTTLTPEKDASPQVKITATQHPRPTNTSAPTSTSTLVPTIEPTHSLTSTPTLTPTQTIAGLVPGIYGTGGCNNFTSVHQDAYSWGYATFDWCVEYIEILKDGSLVIIMSWTLVDTSYNVERVTKRSDVNNTNMYLTDNRDNRYDAFMVSGDAADDIQMVKDVTYYGTFTFRPPKPGAFKFTFHDDDNDQDISNIVLLEPTIYIYDLDLKGYPLAINYYSDKWVAGENDQGGIKLTHLKYANCEVTEWEPGQPLGNYRNTIDIGTFSYDMYSTQQPNWSLREYVLVGGMENVELPGPPLFHVNVPYDNPLPCLDDVSSVLASLYQPLP